MKYRVLIQPTAKAELREAYRWYNNFTVKEGVVEVLHIRHAAREHIEPDQD